jgi:DNA helicase-2/ATP-dependent DNA helicase PcrA
MGYGSYLDRNKLSDSKIQILRLLSYQVERPEELLTRLKELETILKEKQSKTDCPFILSTIHASKGLEYDTVYLMDVIDGIFPQEIPDISLKNKQIRKTCTGEDRKELETYEEERRIFYVGVTRAKNQLILFNYKNEATSFIHQFMESYAVKTYDKIRTAQASAKLPGSQQESREVRSKEAMNAWKRKNQSYYIKAKEGKSTTISEAFMIKLKPGNKIMHRTLGKGCITMMDDVKVRIKFDNGKESVFLISYLYQNRLIQFL